ncbi:glycosyltransferase family 4 protein [Acidicapsa ligni]|uniref:glycosyltransferase family 4 protein n=1 Tax=Acidicapsa ligni TaxID=542300 RepID=UPI0021E00E3B|nr:glycosyltransferase family 4 protein [Acidicapsa ligni]
MAEIGDEDTLACRIVQPREQSYSDLITDQTDSARPAMPLLRMVVGVTSAQTCLVLTGRLGALRRAGLEVTLVSSPGELLDRTAESEGVAAHSIQTQRGIAPISDLLSFFRVLIFLARVKPLITDFSTPKMGLLGNVAAWMLRVPHRVYTLRGLKLESSRGWKRSVLLRSERLAAWCAHVVLCNSESLLSEAQLLGVAPKRKLHVLGNGSSNGVDTDRFSPGVSSIRGELGIAKRDVVLGFVGRLTRDKGVPELLIAFDAVLGREPDCWLLLVGWFDAAEDALEERWRERIAGHPRILHVGFVADTASYYRAMDMLILPTHREGFPNVVLEAAASGLPVISTECTGARDAVLPQVTGLLVPPRDVRAIGDAILALVQDSEMRLRMGAAGRNWVMRGFSRDRVLELAVRFYQELL